MLAELVSGEASLLREHMLPPPMSLSLCTHLPAHYLLYKDANPFGWGPMLMTSLNLSTSSKALHTVSLEFRVSTC